MPGNPLSNPNWAPELADTVERYVALVRDNTTAKVVVVVRALVFGAIVGLLAVASLALAVVLGTRLLQNLLRLGGWIDAGSSVWVSYVVMGGILLLAGMLAMRQRTPRGSTLKA